MNKSILYLIISVLLLVSCIPQKKLQYLQEPIINNENLYGVNTMEEPRIKPNDLLLINVTSFDDVAFNYFEVQRQSGVSQASNELALSVQSYSVSDSGRINFPIIGDLHVLGLTLKEAEDLLEKELSPSFDQPSVIIRFSFKNVTVIGEVNSPGVHTYTRNKITIFEAIGLARDLTIHGNRNEVVLIRKVGEEVAKTNIDLTDDTLIFSEYYYLQPDDVLYIKPRKSVKWSIVSTPISLVFSTITTALLVLNAIQTNNRL